jgi:hypothetical protein
MQVSKYYIVTSRDGERPKAWCWEIQRRSKPMGVKLSGDGSRRLRNLRANELWPNFSKLSLRKNYGLHAKYENNASQRSRMFIAL